MTFDAIQWRMAGKADLDAVAYVWHESARDADGAAPEIPTLDQLRSRIDLELASGWHLSIASQHGEIIAMLAVRTGTSVLDQLFVLPSKQGLGAGRALLQRATEIMPEGFTLRTASANHRARRFYERAGLALLDEGVHPSGGYPVCYYGWNVGQGIRRSS